MNGIAGLCCWQKQCCWPVCCCCCCTVILCHAVGRCQHEQQQPCVSHRMECPGYSHKHALEHGVFTQASALLIDVQKHGVTNTTSISLVRSMQCASSLVQEMIELMEKPGLTVSLSVGLLQHTSCAVYTFAPQASMLICAMLA